MVIAPIMQNHNYTTLYIQKQMKRKNKILIIAIILFVILFFYRELSIAIEMIYYGRWTVNPLMRNLARFCFDNGIILPRLF